MTEVSSMLTGRCLCCSVQWEADSAPRAVHHCHCGMCRRWTGAAFATLLWFKHGEVRFTRLQPKLYRSSPIAQRSHCSECGTPVHLLYDSSTELALCVGTLDDAERVTPTYHYGAEGRLSWADIGASLPLKQTQEHW